MLKDSEVISTPQNQYIFKSSILQVGFKRFIICLEQPELNLTIVSAQIRSDISEKRYFSNSESLQMLLWANQKQSIMKIPDMKYLFLKSFEII